MDFSVFDTSARRIKPFASALNVTTFSSVITWGAILTPALASETAITNPTTVIRIILIFVLSEQKDGETPGGAAKLQLSTFPVFFHGPFFTGNEIDHGSRR